jgi:flavin reductase (DIM6/NTAB) family NADH-FMN oxidoreductase RutF
LDVIRDDETGAPVLSDWSALIRCKTTALIPAGDHDIVLSEVLGFAYRPSQPLIFVHGEFASLASEPASVG